VQEYRVKWQQCPHIHHPSRIMFVEAETIEAATEVARDHIERVHGIGWFSFITVEPYTRPTGGRVIEE
jgi:hypothetical protein